MPEILEIIVDSTHRGERLDLFLTSQLPEESRSRLQSLIKEGHVTLDGKPLRCCDKVATGDRLFLEKQPKKIPARAFPEDIPLRVLYEDDDLMVLDKAAGMVVHVGPEHEHGTLVNALLHYWKMGEGFSPESEPLFTLAAADEEPEIDGETKPIVASANFENNFSFRPGIVHRLDKETSGCIIVAKNDAAHAGLTRSFSERAVKKTYLAIVSGKPRHRKGTINICLGRHPTQRLKMTERRPPLGREAITDYEVLASSDSASLVACYPHTGRMHQIRVHLQHLGHPVIGDPIYGKRDSWNRHLLHAWKIAFTHPRTGNEITVEAPLPKDFELVPWKPKIA